MGASQGHLKTEATSTSLLPSFFDDMLDGRTHFGRLSKFTQTDSEQLRRKLQALSAYVRKRLADEECAASERDKLNQLLTFFTIIEAVGERDSSQLATVFGSIDQVMEHINTIEEHLLKQPEDAAYHLSSIQAHLEKGLLKRAC